jgi:hypothetical protein
MTKRIFETGAVRDTDERKLDYEGFLSPFALEAMAKYMDFHRELPDGTLRKSDNWQLGIPPEAYMKSLYRHVIDAWKWHRGGDLRSNETNIIFALCGILFNAQGYLHELLKEHPEAMQEALDMEDRRRKGLPIDEHVVDVDCFLPIPPGQSAAPPKEVQALIDKLKENLERITGKPVSVVRVDSPERRCGDHDDDWKHSIHPTQAEIAAMENRQKSESLKQEAAANAAPQSVPAKSRTQHR